MQRIYSIAIIAAGLIFIVGAAVIISGNVRKNNATPTMTDTNGEKDLAADVIWNAYKMQETLFIYPAEWILTETKTEVNKKMVVTSFRVNSSDDAHAISVSLGCANADADAIDNSDCVKDFLLRAEDDTPLTLAIYSHMKAFILDPNSETGEKKTLLQ